MNHRAGGWACIQESLMEKDLLRRLIPPDMAALRIQLGEACRVQVAEAGVGGRNQQSVVQANGNVATRPHRIASVKERFSEPGDRVPSSCFGHERPSSTRRAFSKKSGAPKFPDFKAIAKTGWFKVRSAGTPGSISGPIANA